MTDRPITIHPGLDRPDVGSIDLPDDGGEDHRPDEPETDVQRDAQRRPTPQSDDDGELVGEQQTPGSGMLGDQRSPGGS